MERQNAYVHDETSLNLDIMKLIFLLILSPKLPENLISQWYAVHQIVNIYAQDLMCNS